MEKQYETVDTRIIYLTSASRVNQDSPIYDADYVVEPFVFSVAEDEYIELQLSTFVCKYSFYNIDTDRNSRVDLSVDSGVSFATYNLPTGNYSTKEIASNIQTILRSATGDNITVVWNKNKNKYQYTADSVPLANIVLKFPVRETGYEIYGFSKSQTTLNGDGTRQFTLSGVDSDNYSPSIVSIGNEESLYINANFDVIKNIVLGEQRQSSNDFFAKVHIISPFYANIYYVASDYNLFTNHYPQGVSPNNNFNIRITDEVGNPIKLQNEYQLTMRVLKKRLVKSETNRLLDSLLRLNATQLMKQQQYQNAIEKLLKEDNKVSQELVKILDKDSKVDEMQVDDLQKKQKVVSDANAPKEKVKVSQK